jgi:LysM repeat protein
VAIVEPTSETGQDVVVSVSDVVAGQSGAGSNPTPKSTQATSPVETTEPAAPTVVVEADETAVIDPLPTGAAVKADSKVESPTPKVSTCTVRLDWPLYSVKEGDTLFRIARGAGSTVSDLVEANCLADPDRLYSGQQLRVPQLPPDPPTPTPTPTAVPDPWQRYEDANYQVSFDYPARWEDVSDGLMTRLVGDDGWVQVSAAGAPGDLDQVAGDQANHKLRPYGSTPSILPYSLADGRPARLIVPSADQPAEMKGQSMIVAPYADPVLIGSYPHNYLILIADGDHIRDIGATLTLPPPANDLSIDQFSVSGEDLASGGKRLTFRWQAQGANRGVIYSGTHRRFIPWWPVESAGELTVDITNTLFPDPVMTLRMVNDVTGQEAAATAVMSWACQHSYFFQPPPEACPVDAALVVEGAYQPFERGFMIWLPRPDLAQPSIYVFTDDGRVSLYPDYWTVDDLDNGPGESPPDGLFEPVGGFAKVWREHPSVRDDLGWGTAEERLYTVTYQAEARESLPGVSYLTRPDGSILQLLDTIWQEFVPQ